MTVQTLSRTALATIDNSAQAATLVVHAYRAGSARLLDGVNAGLQTRVYNRTAQVAPNLTGAMTQVRDSLSELISTGVSKLGTGSERAIKAGSNSARAGVTRVAKFAAKVQTPVLANGLATAARLSMPGARAACAVSLKLVEGAGRLSVLAAGRKSRRTSKVASKVTSKTATAVKSVKQATQRAQRNVTQAVSATPKKAVALKKSATAVAVTTKRRVARVVAKAAAV